MSVKSLRGSKYYVQCVLLQQVSQGVPQIIEVFTYVPEWSDDCWSCSEDLRMWWWQGFGVWGIRRLLSDCGIIFYLSALNRPVQNGVAERINHTFVELTRSVLSENRMPKAQACETTVYVLICSGKIPVVRKSAVELWNGHVFKTLDHLQVGREVTVHRPIRYHNLIWITYVRLGYMSNESVCAPWCWTHKRMRLHVLCDIRRSILRVIVRKASSTALRKSSLLL